VNFARDVVDAAPAARLALVELARDGSRREWSFGEVAERSARFAGLLASRGIHRGDVVMTLVGNRPEWVFAMLACFRLGAVALACNEQLRAKDLRMRLAAARPAVIVADGRNRSELEAAEPDCEVLLVPDESLFAGPPAPAADLGARDGCLVTFTSGTTGEARGVLHGQRYLAGQRLQAEHWLDARPGDLVWCTAASGWSKSARNVFVAPWLRGAAALLHDARFDPAERLEVLARERVNVLCMAPTEYRVIAKRAEPRPVPGLRSLVAAGEALNPEVLRVFWEAMGLEIRDGYGQTETGQTTGTRPGEPARPGSMGRALPGVRLWVDEGELVADPHTIPTFFVGYLDERGGGTPGPDDGNDGSGPNGGNEGSGVGRAGGSRGSDGGNEGDVPNGGYGGSRGSDGGNEGDVPNGGYGGSRGSDGGNEGDVPNGGYGSAGDRARLEEPWHTGDRVRQDDDGYFYFEGRADDVIISAGYRIGPFEVESSLVSHPAVAEAAVVAAPDEERGSVVRAVVVLRDGFAPSGDLARALQEHVKADTAPYKYPRVVDFAPELPKTASGKVRRAELRGG